VDRMRLTTRILVVIGLVLAIAVAAPGARALAGPPTPSKPATSAPAKGPTSDDCLACHSDNTLTRANKTSVAVDPAAFSSSIHGQAGITCIDCHQDLATAELPHGEKLKPAQCVTCHEAAVATYDRGVHAAARRAAPGTSVAATCADCHGRHDIKPKTDLESRTHHLNLPATCGRCHGNADIIKRGNIAIGDVYAKFQDSIHGKALLKSGLTVAPDCTACHGSHEILRKSDPRSRVFRVNVPTTCGKCHEGIKGRYEAGVHGDQLLHKNNLLAPSCAQCHTAHAIQRVDVDAWKLEVIAECGQCHEESIKTYRDTFHGQVTSLGFVRVAACSDCHGSHEILPASNPKSSVNRAQLVTTCRKCHASAGESFTRYDPHADKANRARNPMLFYAARFMQMLLIGVFAFFGIHTTMWLSRGLAGAKARRARRTRVDRAADLEEEERHDE
jgi:nitrate/TMAO reductase-like tetraheme cytochrome c subunit